MFVLVGLFAACVVLRVLVCGLCFVVVACVVLWCSNVDVWVLVSFVALYVCCYCWIVCCLRMFG